jgi:chromosome segregation protein
MDGDVLSTDGILTGGDSSAADTGMLKRRREIKELTQAKEEWSGKLALAQGSLKKLEATAEQLKKDLDNAHKQKVEKEVLVAELRKDLERAEVELQNLVKAVERQQVEVNQIEAQRMSQESALKEVQDKLQEISLKKVELENKVSALDNEYDSSRTGIDELRNSTTRLQVQSAQRAQESEGLGRQYEMLSKSLHDLKEQLGRMTEETTKNIEVMSLNQVRLEESKVQLEKYMAQAEESERTLSEVRNGFEVESAKARQLEEQANILRREQSQLQMTMNEAKLQLEQARLKEDYLITQIRERYMLDLGSIYTQHLEREGDLVQGEVELADLRDKLGKIGEVNLSAIEEYDEITKRYEFLSQQQTDLLEAKEQLRRVIDRINRICSKRFRETFEQVNERFQKVFPVLFGGGEAKLILIESEEGDEGIDMIARPPGKKLQSVTLLSGGEKALSSVALIFAIFLVKPSPFCLLDEVDAPLDDANVARFNDLVKEMAKRSQIIVVTHNKYTMEINEKLYGVTMQEKGVSKMVSVSLSDARNVVA